MKNIHELLDLSGKVAIVTGGAKGIGRGIVQRLAEAGAQVVIANRDEAPAIETVDELTAEGWNVASVTTDVSSEDDIRRLFEVCQEKFGGVDILVNNAGVFPMVPILQMTSQQFDEVIDINLRGVFLGTKYAAEAMKRRGGGKIINISSIGAVRPSLVGLAHYDASKHGVLGFTKNAAVELAEYNIQVNAIAPGSIATPGAAEGSKNVPQDQLEAHVKAFLAKLPLHRMGDSDDIGKVALFLASDMSNYMTGEQVVVDGGMLLV